MKLKRVLFDWWKEILLAIALIGLIVWGVNIQWDLKRVLPVGLVYGVLEIGWDLSALMVAYSLSGASSAVQFLRLRRFNLRLALTQAAPDRPLAWRWFIVNRSVALIQPLLGGAIAIFVSRVPLLEGLGMYVYIVVDLVHTVTTLWVVRRRLFPQMRVRPATFADLPRLIEIDQAAFTDPAQQAGIDELRRRVQTASETCLVAEAPNARVEGVLYARQINLLTFLSQRVLVWQDCAGDGNCDPPSDADAVFVVGVAADPAATVAVSDILEAALARRVAQLGLKAVVAGVRIPGFAAAHSKADILLDDYVRAVDENGWPTDPLLRHFVRGSSVPVLGPLLRPIRGVRDYFPDPESMDCAALVLGEDPARRSTSLSWLLDHSRILRGVWGRVLEWAMLH
ncbi:hypothetical protein KKB83_05575 [Patescibacteria group bacterium]|nr:hypothetical protein [Patescibacteria group bacterium]